MPLFLFARTSDGQTTSHVSDELPPDVLQLLVKEAGRSGFPETEEMQGHLCSYGANLTAEHYKTYAFPETNVQAKPSGVKCLHRDERVVRDFGFGNLADEVYVIEKNGAILSACVSVRRNAECAEAWVVTQPEHRGMGLGRMVVGAWASALMNASLIPLYSRGIGNLASARLADALELVPVFDEVVITRRRDQSSDAGSRTGAP